MNQGRAVFAQLTDLLPRRAFEDAVRRYGGGRRVRSPSCMDQLPCMIFARVTGRSSLRETVTCLAAPGPRLYHCGIRRAPARSTLADANERRDYRIFMDAAMAMVERARLDLPTDPDLRRPGADACAVDSTTIDLCLKLFPRARFRRRKAGVEAHTVPGLNVGIPVFLRVSHAKTHDLWLLDQLTPQPGACYVLDKGYVDFTRLYRLHQARSFFVTRARRGMDFRVTRRRAVEPGTGVLRDRLIRLRGPGSRKLYPDTLRLIRYADPVTGKRFSFLTNNLTLDAATVALLYRKRWRIELFFKWVKQHLRIKAFFGNTPNAVKTRLWVAVITYVLTARLKHHYQLTRDLNQVLQILSVTTPEKTPVFELFSEQNQRNDPGGNPNQLQLFD